MVLTAVLAALLSISFADAAVTNAMLRGRSGIPQIPAPAESSLTTVYYFDQLIDHNDPSLGTFQQRYWMDWEFYAPGLFLAFLLFAASTYESKYA